MKLELAVIHDQLHELNKNKIDDAEEHRTRLCHYFRREHTSSSALAFATSSAVDATSEHVARG